MKKFIITYHAPAEAIAAMQERMKTTTPEEMQQGMEQWKNWAARCGEHLLDMGSPLFNGQKINIKGEAAESGRQVTGYSILQAESLEEAKTLLQGHPHLNGWHPACEIEIHELSPMPGM